MVQLVRPAEPGALTRNRDKWTARWRKNLEEGTRIDWAPRSAKEALRAPLLAFSKGKCAFCEGMLDVTSFIEIEHYHAKSVRPDLAFEWGNLFPACRLCNGSKGELDHGDRLIKPDRDNPELLFWLNPANGELQPHPTLDAAQAQMVLETIAAYKLQRGALCNARIEMMKFVLRWLGRAAGELAASPECQEEWSYLIRPSTPWKFVIRHVLSIRGEDRLAEIDRHAFLG